LKAKENPLNGEIISIPRDEMMMMMTTTTTRKVREEEKLRFPMQ